MALKREEWKADQLGIDPRKFVFVNETGTNTKMVKAYGRCPTHQRLIGRMPFGHWKTTTFTAGLRCDGVTAPFVLDGPMNRDAFLVYVRDVLGPTLAPGDIVITDNLPAHKGDAVRQLIEDRQATLRFLPPYSPDLNPIELNSRAACARPPNAPSAACETASAKPSRPSHPKNAPTTSATTDTLQLKRRVR